MTLLALAPVARGAAGDVFVADPFSQPGFVSAVVKTPSTGSPQSSITSGNLLGNGLYGIGAEVGGTFVVSSSNGGAPDLIRINPANGAQTVIPTGGTFSDLRYLGIATSGDILVADQVAKKIFRASPAGGTPATFATNPPLNNPVGLDIDSSGNVFVADSGAQKVFKFPPGGGSSSDVSTGGGLNQAQGLGVAPNGTVWVATGVGGSVLKIDPSNGAQTPISGGLLSAPQDVAFDAAGNPLVTDAQAFGSGGIIRIDATTNAQSAFAQADKFQDPRGIYVEPTPPSTPTTPPDKSVTTTVTAKKTQKALKQKGLIVDVTCPQEACTATVAGTLTVSRTSAAKRYKLKQVSKSLTAGRKAAIKLKFTKKVVKAVRRALRARKKVSAKVTVGARDAAGNSSSTSLKIKIKK